MGEWVGEWLQREEDGDAVDRGTAVKNKVDFGYSTSRKLVVEDVVNSGQKMAEEALFLVK